VEHVLTDEMGDQHTFSDLQQLCTLDYEGIHALAFVKAEPTGMTFWDPNYTVREGYLCRDDRVERLPDGRFLLEFLHHGWTRMGVGFDDLHFVWEFGETCIGARPCLSNADRLSVRRQSDETLLAEGLPATCVYTTARGLPRPLTPQLRVPASGGAITFSMGSAAGAADELPVHRVTLNPFVMDAREASNADFALFLSDQGNDCAGHACLDAAAPEVRLHQVDGVWTPDSGSEDLPVVRVTWFGAKAFCDWRFWSGLPSEAQWEAAASAAGTRVYPWGADEPTCELASYDACAAGAPGPGCSKPGGASQEGVCDLAGNLAEWVGDWYQADGYASCAQGCEDPRGPDTDTGLKVVRGGSFEEPAAGLRASARSSAAPGSSSASIGVRCVQEIYPPNK